MMIILPFSSDYVSITNYVPISIKLIQGKVPQFYGGSLIKNELMSINSTKFQWEKSSELCLAPITQ